MISIPTYLLSILFLFQGPISQDSTFTEVATIHNKCSNFTTDKLGNLYLLDPYSIVMYNKHGDSLRSFNSRKYGEISYLDVTDPYQILLFFKDYNMILFLDNYLSENGDPIALQEIGFDQVSFACQSRERGCWLFDPLRQKLMRLNSNFQITHESINLAQWFNKKIEPRFMVEQHNRLYLIDEDNTLYLFDHFGTFIKKIQLKNQFVPQLTLEEVRYFNNMQYCTLSIINLETNCKEFNYPGLKNIRFEKDMAYFNYPNKTVIFTLN